MPRTRAELDRGAKVDQILEAAERIARDRGLTTVSIAEVARSLHLSGNSVYWYFPSRDELWIAVVERIGSAIFARKPPTSARWESDVVWLVDQLADLYPFVNALQHQSRQAPRLEAYYGELRERIRSMLATAIATHVPSASDPDADALMILTVVVGTYALGLDPRTRHQVVRRALAELGS